MRTILKIIAAPFVLALILIVAVLTFLSCVAGAVCIVACVGLSLLAILCLLAGQTVGCIAMFVLAFLVSPFGLPALGGWLVERLHGVKYAAMTLWRADTYGQSVQRCRAAGDIDRRPLFLLGKEVRLSLQLTSGPTR